MRLDLQDCLRKLLRSVHYYAHHARRSHRSFDILETATTNVNDYGISLEEGLKNYLKTTSPYTIPADAILSADTCTGEVNNYKDIWAGIAETDTPEKAKCRIFRSSGLAEVSVHWVPVKGGLPLETILGIVAAALFVVFLVVGYVRVQHVKERKGDLAKLETMRKENQEVSID